MLLVRFVTDWTLYAKDEQAAFNESVAMSLQKHGLALVLGPAEVASIKTPLPGTIEAPVIPTPITPATAAVEDARRRRV